MNARTVRDQRKRQTPEHLTVRDMVRRVTVKLTGALWNLFGYEDPDGNQEPFDDVEVFGNVGFSSRPRGGGNAEVILLHVGGQSDHPVVVATRDRSIEIEIEEDETIIFNSTGACVRVTAAGDVLIGDKDATHPVARGDVMEAKLNALIAEFQAHGHVGGSGSPVTTVTPTSVLTPCDSLSPKVKVT
jgi:hypothetical protein